MANVPRKYCFTNLLSVTPLLSRRFCAETMGQSQGIMTLFGAILLKVHTNVNIEMSSTRNKYGTQNKTRCQQAALEKPQMKSVNANLYANLVVARLNVIFSRCEIAPSLDSTEYGFVAGESIANLLLEKIF